MNFIPLHIVHYKGYAIFYENYMYGISMNSTRRYINITQAMKEIDRMIKEIELLNENPPHDESQLSPEI